MTYESLADTFEYIAILTKTIMIIPFSKSDGSNLKNRFYLICLFSHGDIENSKFAFSLRPNLGL